MVSTARIACGRIRYLRLSFKVGFFLLAMITGTFLAFSITVKKRTGNSNERVLYKSSENDSHIAFRMKLVSIRSNGSRTLLVKRFKNCIASICEHTSIDLTLHIIADEMGKRTVADIVDNVQKICKKGLKVQYYDHDDVLRTVMPQITEIKGATQNGFGMRIRHPLYFFVLVLDDILPKDIERAILLDADFFFQSDIKQLFDHFRNFQPTTIFGMAREQNPVYRQQFEKYRASHPDAKLGEPAPDGVTGFNGGLTLVNLNHMRDSQVYKQLLRDNALKTYSKKYEFKGARAEMDCLVILHMEHPELFYEVPCSWNRQMCKTRAEKLFPDVYDLYHACAEPIHAYHGNCKAKMPNEH